MAEEPSQSSETNEQTEGASKFQKTADQLKAAASAKADEFRTAASAKADEFRGAANARAEELRDKAEEAWDDAKVRARTIQEDGEAYVRENPTRAIVGAVAAGFLLGLILRK